MSSFTLEAQSANSNARAGVLHTAHGDVLTPAFMPVGTQGTVKAMLPAELEEMGVQIVLSNTYHLHLRPGEGLVKQAGGLHAFMGWDKPILTDSGGYQVFSLAALRKLDDEGVTFRSHIDGSERRLTPENVIGIQETLGPDIAVTLDEPVPYESDEAKTREAMERSHEWARRGLAARTRDDQLIFGIVQGGMLPELRRESAQAVADLKPDGFCIGGLSVGEPNELMYELATVVGDALPDWGARHLLGVGFPEDILEGVRAGADIFDCVLPTRLGRNGTAVTSEGRLNMVAAKFAEDFSPLDPTCECPTCGRFTRGYIRHLYKAKEITAARLVTYHNLWYYTKMMERIRGEILAGTFV